MGVAVAAGSGVASLDSVSVEVSAGGTMAVGSAVGTDMGMDVAVAAGSGVASLGPVPGEDSSGGTMAVGTAVGTDV